MKKTALVTGAARGIGLATTQLFLDAGYQVAMVDRDVTALIAAAAPFADAAAFICDVSDPDAVASMMDEVISWAGQLDALVNNAGVADFGPIEETSFERWRNVMATNLDGVFFARKPPFRI